MVDLISTVSIGYHSYDEYASSFMNNAVFRGKTLREWEAEIELPNIDTDANLEDLRKANTDFVRVMRIIISNLAYAKSTYKACCMHYETKMLQARNRVIDKYQTENPGKRTPGADTITSIATSDCQPEFIAMNIAESYIDFWQTHHDKVRYFDSRLNGLGYILSTEEKYQFRG